MSGYLPVFIYPQKLKLFVDTFANPETSKTRRIMKQKWGSWGPNPDKC